MNIGSVNNEKIIKTQSALKKEQAEKAYAQEETQKTAERADRLELSKEAMNLQPVQSRVKEGGYNDPYILKYVAQRLSREIPPTEK